MNSLIIFTSLASVAVGQYWGHPHPVHDTPEVAAAKAEHLAAVAAAKHGVHYAPTPVHYAPLHHYDVPQKKWTGPIALPPGYDKHGAPLPVLDTPEVAAEKSKHFHLYAHGAYAGSAARYAPSHAAPTYVSHGAPTYVSHGAPTYVSHAAPAYVSHAAPAWHGAIPADTPEVAAAKAAHFAAHASRHY